MLWFLDEQQAVEQFDRVILVEEAVIDQLPVLVAGPPMQTGPLRLLHGMSYSDAIRDLRQASMRPDVYTKSRDLPAALALDGAGGETRDVVLHEERVDEGHGNGAQKRPRHQLAPVEGVPADQLAHDADRHGAHARFAGGEEGGEELVMRQRESEE